MLSQPKPNSALSSFCHRIIKPAGALVAVLSELKPHPSDLNKEILRDLGAPAVPCVNELTADLKKSRLSFLRSKMQSSRSPKSAKQCYKRLTSEDKGRVKHEMKPKGISKKAAKMPKLAPFWLFASPSNSTNEVVDGLVGGGPVASSMALSPTNGTSLLTTSPTVHVPAMIPSSALDSSAASIKNILTIVGESDANEIEGHHRHRRDVSELDPYKGHHCVVSVNTKKSDGVERLEVTTELKAELKTGPTTKIRDVNRDVRKKVETLCGATTINDSFSQKSADAIRNHIRKEKRCQVELKGSNGPFGPELLSTISSGTGRVFDQNVSINLDADKPGIDDVTSSLAGRCQENNLKFKSLTAHEASSVQMMKDAVLSDKIAELHLNLRKHYAPKRSNDDDGFVRATLEIILVNRGNQVIEELNDCAAHAPCDENLEGIFKAARVAAEAHGYVLDPQVTAEMQSSYDAYSSWRSSGKEPLWTS